MSKNFFEINNVTFAASDKNKVVNVSLNIENEGDVICLLGPSGIGKTTILRTIAGLEKVQTGKIILNGGLPESHIYSKELILFELTILMDLQNFGKYLQEMIMGFGAIGWTVRGKLYLMLL